MKLTLKQLRSHIKENHARWYKEMRTEKGPCGAVAMAQVLTGYGDTLHWCETRLDSAEPWYSHWTVKKNGVLQDISGCYLESDYAYPLYRRMTRRKIEWPNQYSVEEVNFWKEIILNAEARRLGSKQPKRTVHVVQ